MNGDPRFVYRDSGIVYKRGDGEGERQRGGENERERGDERERKNEARGSLDGEGIRWPEKVELRGEAKEIFELTREFEGGYRGRADLRARELGGSW